jgi:preprotein translocase subunit YajC
MRILSFFAASLLPLSAFAQDAATAATPPSPLTGILPLLLVFVVFYFFLIRPQQRRMRDHQALLGALKKGDEVVTGGGIIGKITKLDTTTLGVEIAPGMEVSILRGTVTGLHKVEAPSPYADKGEKAEKADKKKAASKEKADKKNDNSAPSRERVANDN